MASIWRVAAPLIQALRTLTTRGSTPSCCLPWLMLKFLWADLSGKGAASDAQVYNDSELKQCIDDGTIGFPDPEPLPNDTEDVPYFLVGHDAFALRASLMKPFSRRGLARDERLFNYRLSRTRRVVENAFGILAQRFQVFLTTMQHSPETIQLSAKACMLLHNLMRTRYPGLQNQDLDREDANRDLVPGAWSSRGSLSLVSTPPASFPLPPSSRRISSS